MIQPIRRRLRAAGLALFIRSASLLCGMVSWRVAQRLGVALGSFAWVVARRRRERTLENLALAFPEAPEPELERLARANFHHFGMSLTELLHIRLRSPEDASRHVWVEGFEEIERIRTLGKPIIILAAHCGNWELLSTANQSHGLGLVAMVRQLDDNAIESLAAQLRGHLGSRIIRRGSRSSGRHLLKTLRSGGALVMLIDQDLESEGVFVPFFGRLAHTPIAVTSLAKRLGAEVVPAFLERREDGSHLARFQPAVDLPEDPVAATALLTAKIEEQVRRHPEQWVWFHRRWRRRPPQELTDPVQKRPGLGPTG